MAGPTNRTRFSSSVIGLLLALNTMVSPLSAEPLLTAEFVTRRLTRPTYMTTPPNDASRLFVIEQHTGRIRIVDPETGDINAEPFLTVPGLSMGNEQGLLGLAFHPSYDENGLFYVNFTNSTGTTIIRRYQVSDDPNIADPETALDLMSYSQPFSNHNGGWIGFGPNDGYLYISSGDGGSGFDPGNRAQDITDQKLGKLLRIDVDGDDFPTDDLRNYAIPPSNPFVGQTGDDEIWAFGLRNPWRASFDRETGDLYIGDVGQGEIEEIDFQPAGSSGGENYGWVIKEGTRLTGMGDPMNLDLVDPIHEYTHANNNISVTGGYVYRGNNIGGDLEGTYFFADFGSGSIWSFRWDGNQLLDFAERTDELRAEGRRITQIASFAEDSDGTMYVVSLAGSVYRILAVPAEGDIDADGDVDIEDFNLLKDGFGVGTTLADGDVNGDMQVDLQDFSLLKSRFGTDSRSQQAEAVPEPASIALFLLGIAAFASCERFLRRKRV